MPNNLIPRAKTKEEVRIEFLKKIKQLVDYWSSLPGEQTVKERCDGVAFSILNIFDGTSMDLPAIDLVLQPHEADKEFSISQNENWYEPEMVINDDVHLHEVYCSKIRT